MLGRFIKPHSIIITLLIFGFMWVVDSLRLNMHYLDPFNNGLKEYETIDIVYAYLSQRPKYYENRIVLVNCGKPDRGRLAALVERLHAAEAKVIGIDLFFDEIRKTATDTALQQALEKAGNIVLAAKLSEQNAQFDEFEELIGVHPFFDRNVELGYVNFPANETKTIRLFSPYERVNGDWHPAFSTQIVKQFDGDALDKLDQRKNPVEYIYYIGDKEDYTRFELEYLVDSLTIDQARRVIRDKIVLVGYVPENDWFNQLTDRFYTPWNKNYAGKSIPDMFGVVIHANVISMMLSGNYINDTPVWVKWFLSLVFCYVNVVLIHWMYLKFHESFHGITRALQGVEFLVIFFLIAFLFYHYRIRFEFGPGIYALLLAYDIIMIYEHFLRNRIPVLEHIPNRINWRPRQRQPSTEPSENTIFASSEEE